MRQKIIKFCIAGVISAIIDIGILSILVELFSTPILTANTISFLIAVINSYFINKYWTWKDFSKNHKSQFSKFFIISTIGLIMNLFLMSLALSFNLWYLLAKVIIILIVAIWNFTANHLWTFSEKSYEKAVDNHPGI